MCVIIPYLLLTYVCTFNVSSNPVTLSIRVIIKLILIIVHPLIVLKYLPITSHRTIDAIIERHTYYNYPFVDEMKERAILKPEIFKTKTHAS